MEEKLKKQSIYRLDVKDKILQKLSDNHIETLGQLCKQSRSDLKKIGIESYEAKELDIELQLNGLYLNGSL